MTITASPAVSIAWSQPPAFRLCRPRDGSRFSPTARLPRRKSRKAGSFDQRGLVKSTRAGKEKLIAATDKGHETCLKSRAVREALLVDPVRGLGSIGQRHRRWRRRSGRFPATTIKQQGPPLLYDGSPCWGQGEIPRYSDGCFSRSRASPAGWRGWRALRSFCRPASGAVRVCRQPPPGVA
ncbi:hypothetical protein RHECIAT_PA0000244 (plasmid) [Rhizobium etli CIAT 652]|uniref:Uncharacterized protein n=1 Tax=Rhizobium etli (strain CIAT 652) TaxID=491916 RepID=B3Q1N2_RHIE6|nr:hypothetical protein RHECIAT_PA0000244 [Rhizobium etli CIAT 652]